MRNLLLIILVFSSVAVSAQIQKNNKSALTIEKITCAGEPGASIPATKKRMEAAWGAKVYDHIGAVFERF